MWEANCGTFRLPRPALSLQQLEHCDAVAVADALPTHGVCRPSVFSVEPHPRLGGAAQRRGVPADVTAGPSAGPRWGR